MPEQFRSQQCIFRFENALSQQVYDFAGGIVVHATSGWSALALAYGLGRRQVQHSPKPEIGIIDEIQSL